MQVNERQPQVSAQFVDSLPSQKIVVNYLANSRIGAMKMSPWRRYIRSHDRGRTLAASLVE
jgi:hypothetical protein